MVSRFSSEKDSRCEVQGEECRPAGEGGDCLRGVEMGNEVRWTVCDENGFNFRLQSSVNDSQPAGHFPDSRATKTLNSCNIR